HTRAHDLQPARPLAKATALTLAYDAIHVHLDAGLSERKVAGADTHFPVVAEQPPRERDNRPLQVSHGDAGSNGKTFHLMEHDLAAGCYCLVAIAHSGQNDTDRLRAKLAHDVDLAGRRVGAQQNAWNRRIKRVPHVACRVVFRHVQQLEIRLIVFNLTATINLKAEVGENGVDAAQHLRGDVQPATTHGTPGKRHVDPVDRDASLDLSFLLGRQRNVVCGGQRLFDLIRFLAVSTAVGGRYFAYPAKRLRNLTLLAEVFPVAGTHRPFGGTSLQFRQAPLFQGC